MRTRVTIAILALAGTAIAGCSRGAEPDAAAQTKGADAMSQDIYALSTKTLEGEAVKLDTYRGKVSLIVNVASECGFTPQYAGLEKIYEKYAAKGFVVLGFPSNDFG